MDENKSYFARLKENLWDNPRNRTGVLTTVILLLTIVFLVYNYREKSNINTNPEVDLPQTEQNNQNDSQANNGDVLSGNTAKDTVTYTVLEGDSLWSIATDKLDDGFRWKEIADLNNLEPDASGIYEISTGQNLQVPALPENEVASNESDPEQLANTAIGEETTIYTVVRGDTLWDIAEKVYGDGTQWRLIDEANDLGRLSDGSVLIHAGNQLICPALR